MSWLSDNSGSCLPVMPAMAVMVGVLGLTAAVAAQVPGPGSGSSEFCAIRFVDARAAAGIDFQHYGERHRWCEIGPQVRGVATNEEIPAALEKRLDGAERGAKLEVALESEQAFGEYDVEGVVNVPRAELPDGDEIQVGDWIALLVSGEEDDEGRWAWDKAVGETEGDQPLPGERRPILIGSLV